ncbi:MAG: hypothetical protein ABGX16_08505 [Pirellulales bacterium]
MTAPLEQTLEILAASPNEAAVETLIAALEQKDSTILEGAIQALIHRRSKQGHLAVLRKFDLLTADRQQLLKAGRGHINGALRDAIVSEDDQLFVNACTLVEQFSELDLIPTLISVAENPKSTRADQATQVVCRLVQQLSHMLHTPQDDPSRRRISLMQSHVLENLERCVERFRQHNRLELIEAFVILSGPKSSLLQSILAAPLHPCFTPVLHTLTKNPSQGVIGLLMELMQKTEAPPVVTKVVSRRSDSVFVARLLAQVDSGFSPKMCQNLNKIEKFAWLNLETNQTKGKLPSIAREYGPQVVPLVKAANFPRKLLLQFLEDMLHEGCDTGRLAACEALVSIQGDWPNRLLCQAMDDVDPRVQAVAILQMQNRQIPDTLPKMLTLLDSPHEIIREAARESLQDLSFANFLARYDSLSDDVRRSTGPLVSKVDLQAVPQLLVELQSKSRSGRLRAIEMAETMRLIPQITGALIERLHDKDHLVRATVASVLYGCNRVEVRAALLESTQDQSLAVQNAARASLASLPPMPVMPPGNENHPLGALK